MRILLINYMDTLTPGGINTVVRELAIHLAEKDIKYLCLILHGRERDCGIINMAS